MDTTNAKSRAQTFISSYRVVSLRRQKKINKNEGKLKKRIQEKVETVDDIGQGYGDEWWINPKRSIDKNKPFIEVDELLKILGEMWSEFPCGKCPWLGRDEDNCINYCCGRYENFHSWFKKWRGEKK